MSFKITGKIVPVDLCSDCGEWIDDCTCDLSDDEKCWDCSRKLTDEDLERGKRIEKGLCNDCYSSSYNDPQ